MFDIGFQELLLCAIIALVVLGPERLPKVARTAGIVVGKIRRSVSNIQQELEHQVRADALREKMKDPFATFLDDDDPRITRTNTPENSAADAPSAPPATPIKSERND